MLLQSEGSHEGGFSRGHVTHTSFDILRDIEIYSYIPKFDTCICCKLTYFKATYRCNGDL